VNRSHLHLVHLGLSASGDDLTVLLSGPFGTDWVLESRLYHPDTPFMDEEGFAQFTFSAFSGNFWEMIMFLACS